eukprot:gene4519-5535_t
MPKLTQATPIDSQTTKGREVGKSRGTNPPADYSYEAKLSPNVHLLHTDEAITEYQCTAESEDSSHLLRIAINTSASAALPGTAAGLTLTSQTVERVLACVDLRGTEAAPGPTAVPHSCGYYNLTAGQSLLVLRTAPVTGENVVAQLFEKLKLTVHAPPSEETPAVKDGVGAAPIEDKPAPHHDLGTVHNKGSSSGRRVEVRDTSKTDILIRGNDTKEREESPLLNEAGALLMHDNDSAKLNRRRLQCGSDDECNGGQFCEATISLCFSKIPSPPHAVLESAAILSALSSVSMIAVNIRRRMLCGS